MRYLSAEDILLIHSVLIDETGGAHGLRDQHAVLSLEKSPQQKTYDKELYPTIFHKAALYARDIILNHPFVDGNKRTGITSAFVFLENNGYVAVLKKGEAERFALRIVNKKLTLDQIAAWLKKHSRRR